MERDGPFSREEADDDRHSTPRGYEVKLNIYDMVCRGFGRQRKRAIYIHTTPCACTRTHAYRCGLTNTRRALELVRFTRVSKCTGKVSVVLRES